MNDQDKMKGNGSNPQNRLLWIVLGSIATIIGLFLLSYIVEALDLFGSGSNSVASIKSAPTIESIPGIGDPSVEYSRLIAEQNKALVEKAKKEGGSSLPTVIRPQYSLNTDAFNGDFEKNIKRDENRCSTENLQKARKSGVSASELKCYGCSVEDLKSAGYSAADLKAAGFSAEDLKAAGFSAEELRDAGFSAAELRAIGFSAEELLNAGYSVQELLDSGFTPKQLLKAGTSVADLRNAGVDVELLMAEGVNAQDMIQSGYCSNGVMLSASSSKKLRQDGVTAADLYEGGATIEQLVSYGYGIREILDIGVSISQMLSSGISPDDLREIGVPKKDISFAEKNLSQIKGGVCTATYATSQYNAGVHARVLWPLGCEASVLREAGYSARDLIREGITAGQLRAGGYEASSLAAAGVQLKTLIDACYSVDSLLEAGFTASQLADAGVPIQDLLAYGFSATELAASGVDCAELYKGGVPLPDLYSLGCNAEELRKAGASAAELLNAGFSTADLRAAGFSVDQLMLAGVSADDLMAAGVSPTEMLESGYTEGQLLRAGVGTDQLFGTSKHHDTGIGCSEDRINSALNEGSTVADLLEKGCSIDSLVNAGIGTSELLMAGVKADALIKSDVSVSDLVASGVSVDQLVDAKVDPRDLYLAGIDLSDIKGYTLDQLRAAGYDVTDDFEKDLTLDQPEESDIERVQRMQNQALEQQDRERRIMQLASSMQAQASALFSDWDSMPKQSITVGQAKPSDYRKGYSSSSNVMSDYDAHLGPVVKAGTMMYATMDNSINSEDPTPIRATIISGPLKGAKVLGEFEQDNEKLVLKFDRVDVPGERNTKDISLFAVDVNTARNVTVDSHYLLKYGSLFAASFLEGMNEVASNVGTSVSTDGQTVTIKEGSLDKAKVLSAGLGKVGKNLVAETNKFQSKPATIRMQVGATFGILVMEDFTVSLG